MNYPEYKHTYQKIKCYEQNVYIDSVATYKYIPEKKRLSLDKANLQSTRR